MADNPDPLAQLLAKGRAASDQRVSHALTSLTEEAIQKFFTDILKAQTPQGVLDARLTDSAVVNQFLAVANGQVYTLSFPHVMMMERDGAPEALLVGSLSNQLNQMTPVAITLTRARGWVSTLVPRGVVDEWHLPALDLSPDDIQSDTVPAVDSSLARLEFPGVVDGDAGTRPAFGAIPALLPLPKGVQALDGVRLTLEAIPSDAPVPVQLWLRAMLYAITKNNGSSVTLEGPLFAKALFTGEAMAGFDGKTLLPQAEVAMEALTPTSSLYGDYLAWFNTQRDAIYVELGRKLSGGDLPLPGGPPGQDNQLASALNTLGESIQSGFGQGQSTKEKERLQMAENVITSWSLLLGRIVLKPDGSKEWVPAELTEQFSSVLRKVGQSAAQQQFSSMVGSALEDAAKSPSRLDFGANYRKECINAAFTDAARLFEWVEGSVLANPMMVLAGVSLFTFAPPLIQSAEFLALADENAQTRRAILSESKKDASLLSKGKLFLGGDLSTADHARQALLNFRIIAQTFITNFDECYLWTLLGAVERMLAMGQGRDWCVAVANYPGVPLNILLRLQNGLSSLVAQAKRVEYIEAAQKKQPISHLFPQDLAANCLRLEQDLRSAITHLQPLEFAKRPAVLAEALGIDLGASKPAKVKAEPSSTSGSAAKKGRGGDKPVDTSASKEAERQDKMTKGMLKWTGPPGSKPPPLNVYHKGPGMKTEEKICPNFIYVGQACMNPKCKRPHVTNLARLSDKSVAGLVAQVEHPNVEWMPGKGPSGI